MASNRVRVFVGATEIDYNSGYLELSDDEFVNNGELSMVADSNVTDNATLDIRKEDGSTSIFTTKAVTIEKELLWKVTLYGEGWELNNKQIQKLYQNQAPEDIIEDVVDNFTENLTFASTDTSSITLDDYIANGYLIDVIVDMLNVLQWRLRIDKNGNVYAEPPGSIENNVILSEDGDGDFECVVNKRSTDTQAVINRVKLIGGFEGRSYEETVSGTGTEFTLNYKPSGGVSAGSDAATSDIEKVEAENKKVIFNSSKTDPTFFYTYNRPVVIDDQDDESINTYGEIFKEINRTEIVTAADGRRFTQKFLAEYSEPPVYAEVTLPNFNFDLAPNEKVRVRSDRRGMDELLIINKIQYVFETGQTKVFLGSREEDFLDWRRGVESRIKQLEKRYTNDGDIIFSRLIKNGVKVQVKLEVDFKQNSPQDTLIPANVTSGTPDGPTLCWPRGGYENEPDCSLNENHGVWSGTNVATGSHYTQSGARLGAVDLNGSDHECALTSSIDVSDKTIAVYLRIDDVTDATYGFLSASSGGSSTGHLAIQESGGAYTLEVSDDAGTTDTLATGLDFSSNQLLFLEFSSGTITVHDGNNNELGTLSIGSTLTVQYVGVGNTGEYWDGLIDELMIFTGTLTSSERDRVIAKNITGSPDLRTSMVLWYAMDNPTPGDKSTTKTTVS